MTENRRTWTTAFSSGAATAADVRRAAETCMRELCDDAPAECAHTEQLMTPLEFAEWLEREVVRLKSQPVRLDQREGRRAGQHRRYALNAATA